jgi:DNA-binding CsgD family transcriptional regulator
MTAAALLADAVESYSRGPRPLELALAAEGLSNPQIGERLYISRRTDQTHVAHIFMKLGISSHAQLAAEVIRQPGRG